MSSAFVRRELEDLGADGSADAISDILNMLYCSGKHRFLFAQVDNRSNERSQNRHSCVGIKLESKEVYHGGPPVVRMGIEIWPFLAYRLAAAIAR